MFYYQSRHINDGIVQHVANDLIVFIIQKPQCYTSLSLVNKRLNHFYWIDDILS